MEELVNIVGGRKVPLAKRRSSRLELFLRRSWMGTRSYRGRGLFASQRVAPPSALSATFPFDVEINEPLPPTR